MPDCVAALIALADALPVAFQAALVPVLQHLLARGLRNVPEVRTISDVKMLSETHRKTAGLDAKDTGCSYFMLVHPIRSHQCEYRPRK